MFPSPVTLEDIDEIHSEETVEGGVLYKGMRRVHGYDDPRAFDGALFEPASVFVPNKGERVDNDL